MSTSDKPKLESFVCVCFIFLSIYSCFGGSDLGKYVPEKSNGIYLIMKTAARLLQ